MRKNIPPTNAVQVHVRNDFETDSSYLGCFEIHELEDLVRAFNRWGTDQDNDSTSGQFAMYQDGEIGFEIVLHQAE